MPPVAKNVSSHSRKNQNCGSSRSVFNRDFSLKDSNALWIQPVAPAAMADV
jgi:hypothetical protein